MCETPRIGEHRDAIRARIAAIAGIDVARVGVKATTSERMGFTGRGEGLMAMATATVRLPWSSEAAYALPVRVWKETMERYFRGTAWVRLSKESFDRLSAYKARNALATWDDALEALGL